VRLLFTRTSRDGCGKQVVFPSLGVTRDVPLDKPVEVDLVAPKGELAFTCGMHMLKGSVVGL
jgi:plastocyanin domain-containing protein